jgi:hypothetical protein
MTTVYYDPPFDDEARRNHLYEGDLIVLSPSKATLAFCQFAKDLVKEAFAPLDPESAQYHLPVEKYAEILGKLKPTFIHHPETKNFMRNLLKESGCDIEKTYYEVPKLRSSTSDGYLTTGIAYAWHPHRDTWTAALPSQINWWIPVYELLADNALTFFPQYWDKPVKNSSSGYNYFQWNQQHRGGHVTKYLKEDPRPIPRPQEEIQTSPEIRLIPPVGGVVLFSAAHLHASVPNTSGRTRFSFDFRTVQLDDIAAKHGAPNIDSECKGHMLRDYIRPTDLTQVPEEYMALYDDGSEKAGALVYTPAERLLA